MRSTPQVMKLTKLPLQVSYEFLVRRTLGTWRTEDITVSKSSDKLNHVADVGWTVLMSV